MNFRIAVLFVACMLMGGGREVFVSVQAQAVYPNADFETGTFAGWGAWTGSCCPITTPVAGFDSMRHVIMSGPGTDPYSMGLIPVVAPGGSFSARLGNDNTGAQAERLSYTFVVKPESPFFVYRYAVIFEFPPDHPESKQPRFEVILRDASGQPLECGYYRVTCADQIEGFIANGHYRIRPWTDVGVNLSDYIGQTITVEFATGDCGMGGHFGYAYIDAYTTAMKIETSGCNDDGTITITAPAGFLYQWSTGHTTQSIQVSTYNHGDIIHLILQAANGCNYYMSIPVPDFVPLADFSYLLKCNGRVEFFNTSSDPHGNILFSEWHFGQQQISTVPNPIFQFDQYGSYPVTLMVTSSNACRSTVVKTIEVKPVINADFEVYMDCHPPTFSFHDRSTVLNGNIVSWNWEIHSQVLTGPHPVFPWTEEKNYTVRLTVVSDEPCQASVHREIVADCPDPVNVYVPTAFTPDANGKNECFLPVFSEPVSYTLHIFNRWGMKVFTGQNEGWKGQGSETGLCQQGVYLYKLEWNTPAGIRQVRHGHVTLLR